jgi:hypothetical protein
MAGLQIGTWANTSAWVVYALLIKDNAILIVNAIGAGIALIYLGVFLLYSPSISRTALHLAGVLAASAVVYSSIALPTSIPIADKVLAMGSVAVACNVVMYAAPLAQLHIALSTFDPAAIPTLLVLVRIRSPVIAMRNPLRPPPPPFSESCCVLCRWGL